MKEKRASYSNATFVVWASRVITNPPSHTHNDASGLRLLAWFVRCRARGRSRRRRRFRQGGEGRVLPMLSWWMYVVLPTLQTHAQAFVSSDRHIRKESVCWCTQGFETVRVCIVGFWFDDHTIQAKLEHILINLLLSSPSLATACSVMLLLPQSLHSRRVVLDNFDGSFPLSSN